jgi:hypothetical protein
MRRALPAGLTAAIALIVAGVGCASHDATPASKVIVLGFDGLDHALTEQMINAGRLPGFARLANSGGFAPLGTTVPPQSPVAWSTFITGLDPGGHGIFDFVHRDPVTMNRFHRWAKPWSRKGLSVSAHTHSRSRPARHVHCAREKRSGRSSPIAEFQRPFYGCL